MEPWGLSCFDEGEFVSWYEWKARQLNRMLGGGSITAATVQHGERNTSHAKTFMAQGMSKAQLRRTNKRQWHGLQEKSAAS